MIECPNCGIKQAVSRTDCYYCGFKFNNKDVANTGKETWNCEKCGNLISSDPCVHCGNKLS